MHFFKTALVCIALLTINQTNCFALNSDCPEKVSAIEYFQSVEKKFNIEFSYSNTIWKDIKICSTDQSDTLEQELVKLSTELPLQIKQVDERIFSIIPRRSNLKMKLTDESSSELIPLAYISINNEKKSLHFVNGQYFNIEDVLPSDSIKVEVSFYNPQSISVSSILNGHDEIALKSKVHNIEEVIVLPAYMSNGFDSKMNDASVRINIQELSSIAGESDGDVYQAIKVLPGISSPSGKPGSLIIRGNLYDLNLVQYDEIPIYHIGHLYGAFSPFNSKIINSVDVHRNNVPVEYGGKAGSMVSITSCNDILDSLEAGVLANFVYGGFDISTPVRENKLGILFSARNSLPFFQAMPKYSAISDLANQGGIASPIIASEPGNSTDLEQDFQDVNLKLVFTPNKKNIFSISSIYIKNTTDLNVVHSANNLLKIQQSKYFNNGATCKWKKEWSKKFNSELSFTASRFKIKEYAVMAISSDTVSKNTILTIDDFKINTFVSYVFNNHQKISGGISSGNRSLSTFKDNSIYHLGDSVTNNNISSLYSRYESIWGDKFLSNAGIRLNYNNLTKSVDPDVNINFSYFPNNQLFFKSSLSQMHQYMYINLQNDFEDYNTFTQYWKLAKNKEDIITGRQLMLGTTLKKSHWLVDVEAYYKEIENIRVVRTDAVNEQDIPLPLRDPSLNSQLVQFLLQGDLDNTNQITLKTKGIDFLVKKKWNQIDTWISYTLSQTYFENTSAVPVYFDRLHDVNITAIVPYRRFTCSVNWNLASGLPVLPVNVNGDPILLSQINIPYDKRFPFTHQLDMSVTCKLLTKNKKLDGALGLSILNVYNKKNIVNNYRTVERAEEIYRYGIGFAPNIQLELRFK